MNQVTEEDITNFENFFLFEKIFLSKNPFILFFLLILLIPSFVIGQIEADFTFNYDNSDPQCSPVTISFTNQSTGSGSLTYQWNFGDGNSSSELNPTHTFHAGPGDGNQNFNVRLTVTAGGNSDNHVETITIKRPPGTQLEDINNWPAFSKCSGDGDLVLTVQNNSNSTNTSYHIDWGDGSSFSSDNFIEETKTYASGYYELEFAVTSLNGCVNSEIYPVLNGSSPGLELQLPAGSSGCAPRDVAFPIVIDEDGNEGTIYEFWITLGMSGQIITEPGEFLFLPGSSLPDYINYSFEESSCSGNTELGFYLHSSANNQCVSVPSVGTIGPINITQEPVAIIYLDTTEVCANEAVRFYNHSEPVCGGNPNMTQFTWIVDDKENRVVSSTASQNYEFETPGLKNIRLEAFNSTIDCNAGFSFAEATINVIPLDLLAVPTNFVAIPNEACQGIEVSLSVDEVANATYYDWDLPSGTQIIDGAGSNQITVIFGSNVSSGDVQISVTAENICSESESSESFGYTILPVAGPVSEIEGEDSLCEGQEYTYSYSIEPLEIVGDITWNVPAGAEIISGQGTTEIEVRFTENFSSGSISVFADNECGISPIRELPIILRNLPDKAQDLIGPDDICQNDSASFSIPAIAHATSYAWFLDSDMLFETSQREIIIHMDMEPGEYTISVIGLNDCGEGEPDDYKIKINPIPEPDFAPQNHCFGNIAHFTNSGAGTTEGIKTWRWDFGDGYSSILPKPVHVYDTIGEFPITLEVTSIDGCKSIITDTIIVHDIPVSRFRARRDTAYVGQVIQFIDESYLLHDTLRQASIWFYDFDYNNPDQYTATEQHPEWVYREPGNYKVMQEVGVPSNEVNSEDCSDYSFKDIVVILDVYMPNVFAPGGRGGGHLPDGEGVITFGPLLGGLIPLDNDDMNFEFELAIFNRWGERVYHEKSQEPRWDGSIRGGPIAPQGVYVWMLMYRNAQGKPIVKTGNVLLLK